MLTIQELQSSTIKELQDELSKSRAEFVKIRVGVRTKHTKDTSLVKKQKRYIAQILTLLKEAQIEELISTAKNIKS